MFQEIPMNKVDLITVLKNVANLTKSEAEPIANLFCNLNRAIFKFVVDKKKMSFRYSFPCGMAFDKIDTVILLRWIKIGNPWLVQDSDWGYAIVSY